jgi:Na+/melibiose symporter-like transporter
MSSAASAQAPAKVGLHTKFAFGVGATAEGAVYIGFNTFNLLYYNQVLGVPGTLVGLAISLALIVDAFTDPAIGAFSDRWRSRLGRRHPFLFAAAVPVALSFFMLYSPPSGLATYGLVAWLLAWRLVLAFTVTFFHIPDLALGAELTTHYTQRSSIMSWNSLFGWLGGASAGYFGWGYFFAVRDGVDNRFNPEAYTSFAATIALVSLAVILYSAFFTLDQLPRLPKAPPNLPRFDFAQMFREIGGTLRNRNYRMLLLGLVFLSAALGVQETLSSFMGTYFWGLTGADLRYYSFASAFGYWGAFFFTAALHRRFDKKPVFVTAVVAGVVIGAIPITLRFLDLLPANGSPSLLPILLCFAAAGYATTAILSISVLSALADIADEHELHTGRRQEGIFYASRAFFAQSINGLGHFLGGIVLDVISFPIGVAPGSVSPEIIRNLGLMYGPMAVIPGIVAACFYAQYRIDQRVHSQIHEQLGTREAAAGQPRRAAASRG